MDTFYSERLVFMVYRPITIVGVAYKKGKKISITGNNQWIPSKFVVIFACFSLRTNLHSGIQLESFFVFLMWFEGWCCLVIVTLLQTTTYVLSRSQLHRFTMYVSSVKLRNSYFRVWLNSLDHMTYVAPYFGSCHVHFSLHFLSVKPAFSSSSHRDPQFGQAYPWGCHSWNVDRVRRET